MPYGFVLIKEIPEHWDIVRETLNEYTPLAEKGLEVFKKTGAILLEWYRCFGWADFIAVVWSPNVECIKDWIIDFRDCISRKVQEKQEEQKEQMPPTALAPLTTTVIGIVEDEHKIFTSDINILKDIFFKEILKELEDKSEVEYENVLVKFNAKRFMMLLEAKERNIKAIKDKLKEIEEKLGQ